MPRRNLLALLLIAVFSWACCQKVPEYRSSRVLADAMDHVCRRSISPLTS